MRTSYQMSEKCCLISSGLIFCLFIIYFLSNNHEINSWNQEGVRTVDQVGEINHTTFAVVVVLFQRSSISLISDCLYFIITSYQMAEKCCLMSSGFISCLSIFSIVYFFSNNHEINSWNQKEVWTFDQVGEINHAFVVIVVILFQIRN